MSGKNFTIFPIIAFISIFLLFFSCKNNLLFIFTYASGQENRSIPAQDYYQKEIVEYINNMKPEILKSVKQEGAWEYLIKWTNFYNEDGFNNSSSSDFDNQFRRLEEKYILENTEKGVLIDKNISNWISLSTSSAFDLVSDYNKSCDWDLCNLPKTNFIDSIKSYFASSEIPVSLNTQSNSGWYQLNYKMLNLQSVIAKLNENKLFYEKIFENVDLIVSVFKNWFKEEIVLNSDFVSDLTSYHPYLGSWLWIFSYEFYAKDLHPRLVWHWRSLQFLNELWDVSLQIPVWYTIDALWKISFNVVYSGLESFWNWNYTNFLEGGTDESLAWTEEGGVHTTQYL